MSALTYNEATATAAGLTLCDLGLLDWNKAGAKVLQRELVNRGEILAVDGWLGPVTLAAWDRHHDPAMAGECVEHTVNIERRVIRGTLTTRNKRKRRPGKPISIGIHDTVSRTAAGTNRYLERKGLSTNYYVDEDGAVYEVANPGEWTTYHGGYANDEAIGVDMVCLLDGKSLGRSQADKARRGRLVKVPWARKRVIDYTDAQKAALVELVRWLCAWFAIPFEAHEVRGKYGKRVPRNVMDMNDYRGIAGHGQWSTKRWDGNRALDVLFDAGMGVIR